MTPEINLETDMQELKAAINRLSAVHQLYGASPTPEQRVLCLQAAARVKAALYRVERDALNFLYRVWSP
jgi:hypothetical protein